jgi:hypothetical protein
MLMNHTSNQIAVWKSVLVSAIVATLIQGCGSGGNEIAVGAPSATSAPTPAPAMAPAPAPSPSPAPVSIGKSWKAPIALVSNVPSNESATNAALALSGGGNALAIWGERSQLFGSKFDPIARIWNPTVPVRTNNPAGLSRVQIAKTGNGNAIAVWLQTDGIWFSRYAANTAAWSDASQVTTEVIDFSDSLRVAADTSGNAILVSQRRNGAQITVVANRYTASTDTWSSATVLNSGTTSTGFPRIALDPLGNAIVVWNQVRTFPTADVWANRFNVSTGSWGVATRLTATNSLTSSDAAVAVDGNGNATAVWQEEISVSPGVSAIKASRYSAALGTWSQSVSIESNSTSYTNGPEIGVDSDGNVTAAWLQFTTGTTAVIKTSRYNVSSSVWATATNISSEIAGLRNVKIAVSAIGEVLAIWEANQSSVKGLYSNRYAANASGSFSWGNEILVSAVGADTTTNPIIVADEQGNALATWTQLTGTARVGRVVSARFD